MKTIIIYNSQTGFTKKYADWIREELNCNIVSFKNIPNLNNYDIIIYGGGIFAGFIRGLKKFKRIVPDNKKVVIYATGLMPSSPETIEKIKNNNSVNYPFFYFQGGLNYEEMNPFNKIIMKMLSKILKKKKEKTEEEKLMSELVSNSSDFTNENFIRPLINHIKKIK